MVLYRYEKLLHVIKKADDANVYGWRGLFFFIFLKCLFTHLWFIFALLVLVKLESSHRYPNMSRFKICGTALAVKHMPLYSCFKLYTFTDDDVNVADSIVSLMRSFPLNNILWYRNILHTSTIHLPIGSSLRFIIPLRPVRKPNQRV